MTEPVDLMQATQDAVLAALVAGVPTSLSPVFQHVPQNTQPPMTIVGDIEAAPGESKGSEEHGFEVEFVSRGKSRRELLAMMDRARRSIEGGPLSAAGSLLGKPRWQSSHTERQEDGVTYAGLLRYTVSAEPA